MIIGKTGGQSGQFPYNPEILESGIIVKAHEKIVANNASSISIYGRLADTTNAGIEVPNLNLDYNILIVQAFTNIRRTSSSSAYTWRKEFDLRRGSISRKFFVRNEALNRGGTNFCDNQAGNNLDLKGIYLGGQNLQSYALEISLGTPLKSSGAGSASYCDGYDMAEFTAWINFPTLKESDITVNATHFDVNYKVIKPE